MKQQPYRPVLITDARPSQDDQLRSRQTRYLLMMSIRVACLLAGAVLIGVHAPGLWLWLPACVLGMVLMPWLAVIVANDRPAKEEHRLANVLHRARTGRAPGAAAVGASSAEMPSVTPPDRRALPAERQGGHGAAARPAPERTLDAEP